MHKHKDDPPSDLPFTTKDRLRLLQLLGAITRREREKAVRRNDKETR